MKKWRCICTNQDCLTDTLSSSLPMTLGKNLRQKAPFLPMEEKPVGSNLFAEGKYTDKRHPIM